MYKIHLLFFLLSLQFSTAKAQQPSDNVQKLIDKGITEYNSGNYSKSLEYYTKAEVLAGDENPVIAVSVKNAIGRCYLDLSDYNESLSYFEDALSVAEKFNLLRAKFVVLSNIGVLYADQEYYTDAINTYKKVLDFCNKNNDDSLKRDVIVNISDAYNKTGNYKEAQQYLNSVQEFKDYKNFNQIKTVNYAESLLTEGKPLTALDSLKKLSYVYSGNIDNNNLTIYSGITELLSRIHFSLKNDNLTIYYANKCLQHTDNLKIKTGVYNILSNMYARQKNYGQALIYKDSVIRVKDSLSKLITRGLYQSSRVKSKIQDYKDEIRATTEKTQQQRNLFIVVIIIIVFAAFGIYRLLKNKIAKQRQEKLLLSNNQRIAELELENLKNDIAQKNRDMTARALFISDRNTIISEVINSLSDIPEILNNSKVKTYIDKLKDYLNADNNWEDFIHYFEQINPNFMKALYVKHPELNTKEIRFLCYIYMNLEMKEISNILNITYNSAMKKLYRIKKKMNISDDLTISEYLLQII